MEDATAGRRRNRVLDQPYGEFTMLSVEHSLLGGTGHLFGMGFTSSISIYYKATMEFFDFATHRSFPSDPDESPFGLSISADGNPFVCSRQSSSPHHVGETSAKIEHNCADSTQIRT
jgi:hypothetical protein